MNYNDAKELFFGYEIDLSPEKYEKFADFERILLEYNKVMNLTAITESREIWIKHFLDSSVLAVKLEISRNSAVIDIGCGAGFPSVPLSIIRPDLDITLLDSLKKRVSFLNDVILKLDLKRCTAIHERAEIAGKMVDYREKYDLVTARAVANMNVLSEYCLPFAKIGGVFAAMKGTSEDIQSSINGIEVLGGKIENEIKYNIEDNSRVIYSVKKVFKTDIKYPRSMKNIKNKPL